jgi:hypothetical protein
MIQAPPIELARSAAGTNDPQTSRPEPSRSLLLLHHCRGKLFPGSTKDTFSLTSRLHFVEDFARFLRKLATCPSKSSTTRFFQLSKLPNQYNSDSPTDRKRRQAVGKYFSGEHNFDGTTNHPV